MTYFPPNCSWCGHAADHPHPCDRTIETRNGPKPCPCKRAELGEAS